MASTTRSSRAAPEPGAARRWRPLLLALAVALLAACARGTVAAPPQARIDQAVLVAGPALEADLRLVFSATMLEALDRGIPLTLTLELRATSATQGALVEQRRMELRYLPLAQQYQWAQADGGAPRNFPRRTQLLAALDHVRVALPAAWAELPAGAALDLRLALDRRALPGPLRLPALLARDWRLPEARYAWQHAG